MHRPLFFAFSGKRLAYFSKEVYYYVICIIDESRMKEGRVKIDFLPIVLGSDVNAYSVARTIYENYGLISHIFAHQLFAQTADSRILVRHSLPFDKDHRGFVQGLLDFARDHAGEKMIIFPCSDEYSEMLAIHREKLEGSFLFNVPSREQNRLLEDKMSFYRVCEEHGIPYPKAISIHDPKELDYSKLRYPIVAKAADSIRYFQTSFPGKKKAYILQSEKELREALSAIYGAGYQGSMIIQDYIPGDASYCVSMNVYSDHTGKVRMCCAGQILLTSVLPLMIGNYDAMYTHGDQALYDRFEAFMNDLHYTGFGNFDLKYDPRDREYKCFEMNLRLPASNFFMQAGGLNCLDFLVRDMLGIPFEEDCYYHHKIGRLFLNNIDPLVLKKYVHPNKLPLVKELLKRKPLYPIWYEKDKNAKRRWRYWRMRLASFKHYHTYGEHVSKDDPEAPPYGLTPLQEDR